MDISAMPRGFLLLLLALLPLFLLRQIKKAKKTAALRLPPGPRKLPIIGNLHQLRHLPHHSLCRLSRQHGPLMHLQLGRVSAIVVSSAEIAREILRNHDLECSGRPHFTATAKLSYGASDVAFAEYGDQWKELRKIFAVELFGKKKTGLIRAIREDEIQRMISSVSSHSVVDLSDVLLALANNIICRAALGGISHGDGKLEWHKVHMMVNEAQALFLCFFMADYIPLLGWVDALTGVRKRLQENFVDFDEFYQQVMDQHLNRQRHGHEQDEDIVDTLLRVQREANRITDDNIKGVLMNIFLAGTDTSSAAVEWAMAELMTNPKAMKRLQDEVRSVVGRKAKVEESDLHQLPYLKSVVKEAIRLHPPAPLLVDRETTQHLTINGYDIPPKTRVMVNAWAIGRDPSSWEMPEEFYPERFMDSSIEMKGNDFELIPFGAGRRICPGMQMGILTVEVALANLVYAFDWKLPKGLDEIQFDEAPGITVHMKSPLKLVATKYDKIDDG